MRKKFLYKSSVLEELQNYLQDNPTENKIYLYEINRIYVTADPGNCLKKGYWLPLGSVYTSPMLVNDPTDEENSTKIQAKISDHAAVLQKNEPVEPGYTYDLNDWQLWGGYFESGYAQDSKKADLSGVERTESLSLEQLEKVSSNLRKPLIYFPQVEIAPSLEVTAPVVGENPSFECKIVDKVGGYSVYEVVWSCDNNKLYKDDKFEAGKEYTVRIELLPDGDLSFVDTTPVTINGEKARTSYGENIGFYAYRSFTTAPEKPVNVKATAGNGKVDLSWEDSEGAFGYNVYFYNEDDTLTEIATVQDFSYTVEDLENGTEYGFIVRAVSEAGAESSYTAEDVVYATPVNPKPQNVKAAAGDGQVTLTWDAVEGATKYSAYTYLNGKFSLIGVTTNTTITATGLTNGTKYGFLVLACVNGSWTKTDTANVVYATPAAAVPSPKFTVTAGDGQATINWTAVTGASKYSAYTYLDGKFSLIGVTTANTITANNLTNGTKYGFIVLACVNGSWTKTDTANVVYATPSAGVPSPEFTVTAGDGQAVINWTAVTGASKYSAYTYLNGKFSLIGITTNTTITATGLTNGTKYGFIVLACVDGKWTKTDTANIVYATPVAAVPSPEFTVTPGDGQAVINWTAVTGASKYSAYTYLNGKFSLIGITTDTTITAKNLANGTEYGFIVLACVDGKWTKTDTANIIYDTPNA